jgi:hypothetical protein
MKLLSGIILFVSSSISAQPGSTKIFTVSGGVGYSNAFKNNTGSTAAWIQTDYQFYKKVSFIMEFETMKFKRPGVYTEFGYPEKLDTDDNFFSVGFKYQLAQAKSKMSISCFTGYTYMIRQSTEIKKTESNDVTGNTIGRTFEWRTAVDNFFWYSSCV